MEDKNQDINIPYKISVTAHQKLSDHVEYVMTVTSKTDTTIYKFSDRYSNLKTLNDLMKKETSKPNIFPKFPPKKFFGSNDEKFLNQRQGELNKYFEDISKDEEFSNLPSLMKYLIENFKRSEKIYQKKNEIIEKENDNSLSYAAKTVNKVIKNDSMPSESDYQPPSKEEIEKENERCKNIINEYNNKLVDYDKYANEYEDKEFNEKQQEEYQKIINEQGIFSEEVIKIEAGNDSNFEYIGKEENNEENIFKDMENLLKKNYKEKNEEFENIYMCKNLIVEV